MAWISSNELPKTTGLKLVVLEKVIPEEPITHTPDYIRYNRSLQVFINGKWLAPKDSKVILWNELPPIPDL